jgi:hypothetical protein
MASIRYSIPAMTKPSASEHRTDLYHDSELMQVHECLTVLIRASRNEFRWVESEEITGVLRRIELLSNSGLNQESAVGPHKTALDRWYRCANKHLASSGL